MTIVKDHLTFLSPAYRELVEFVMLAACKYSGISMDALFTEQQYTRQRQLCFFLIRKNTCLSEKVIGRIFNLSRTAIRYGIEKTEIHVKIYRQSLDTLRGVMAIVNTFDKKYQWHLQ